MFVFLIKYIFKDYLAQIKLPFPQWQNICFLSKCSSTLIYTFPLSFGAKLHEKQEEKIYVDVIRWASHRTVFQGIGLLWRTKSLSSFSSLPAFGKWINRMCHFIHVRFVIFIQIYLPNLNSQLTCVNFSNDKHLTHVHPTHDLSQGGKLCS